MRSANYVAVRARRPYPCCRRCGSTLIPARYEGPRIFAGELVDIWRCGCGRRQRHPRRFGPVEAVAS